MLHSARNEKTRPRATQTTAKRTAVDDIYYRSIDYPTRSNLACFVGEVGWGVVNEPMLNGRAYE